VNRIECLEAFALRRQDAVVIVGPGFAGHELAAAEHHDATLYNMEMGYAAPMCLGLALALEPVGRKVVAIEGDGSMLMTLPTFSTIARYPPRNLVVLVFDNGSYVTTGRGEVRTATTTGTDLAGVARAAGLGDQALSIDTLDEFNTALEHAMGTDGPWVIVARVDTSDRQDPRARQHFDTDLPDQAAFFRRALQR
jgi:thiamine pyrophosphate-dependent acetolactate synthase large subunit-like protein